MNYPIEKKITMGVRVCVAVEMTVRQESADAELQIVAIRNTFSPSVTEVNEALDAANEFDALDEIFKNA